MSRHLFIYRYLSLSHVSVPVGTLPVTYWVLFFIFVINLQRMVLPFNIGCKQAPAPILFGILIGRGSMIQLTNLQRLLPRADAGVVAG